jgi:hypothetical protein
MNVGQCFHEFISFPRSINMSAKIIPEGQQVNLLVTLFDVSVQVIKSLSDKGSLAMPYPNVIQSVLPIIVIAHTQSNKLKDTYPVHLNTKRRDMNGEIEVTLQKIIWAQALCLDQFKRKQSGPILAALFFPLHISHYLTAKE